MNLKQTSERLTVSQTAQQNIQLQGFCCIDRSAECVSLIFGDKVSWYFTLSCVHTLRLTVLNCSPYTNSPTIICSYFHNCLSIQWKGHPHWFFVCTHTVQCTGVCLLVWKTETLRKTIQQILLMHSLWNLSACLIQRKIEEVEYDLRLRAAAHRRLRTSLSLEMKRKLSLVVMGCHSINDDLLKSY